MQDYASSTAHLTLNSQDLTALPRLGQALSNQGSYKQGVEGVKATELIEETVNLRSVSPVNVLIRSLSINLDPGRTSLARHWPISRPSRTSPGADVRSKLILNNINARIPAGSVTAIIGGSGSGKTTLLNALSRRMRDKRLHQTGDILYNGNHKLTSIRSAYAMQQDILIPTLTVRETLEYAAQLRLPPEATAAECRLIVEEVVLELRLQDCANTRIGGTGRGGCSGGEKRRVSLGVQLLANPSVLLLDEVTTGLDAAGAFQLVRLLKQLARRGRTIILTIHQPRSEIWDFFDHIVLLAEGSALFSGPAGDSLHHFDSLGYPIPKFVNPAEHLVDLAAVDSRSPELERASRSRVDELKSAWNHATKPKSSSFASSFDSGINQNSVRRLSPQLSSFTTRVKVQTSRTFRTAWRDPNGIAGSTVECLGMAVLTGWIFYGLDGSQSGIRSREGALYIAAVLQSYLVLLYETYRLAVDIEIFDRENAEGVVDVWSFLLSRRIAKFPIEDLPVPLLYSTIVYFMTGFRPDGEQFAIFFGFILLSHYVSVTLAAVAVALSRDFAGASLFVNMNLNLQALCCGFLLQTNQIPVYVGWMKWLAYAFYSTGALITNEFIGHSNKPSGYLYDCPFPGGASNSACIPWTGKFVATSLGYPQHAWIWRPAVILIGFVGAFWISAGLILIFFKNEMRIARSRPSKHDSSYVDISTEAIKAVPTNTFHVTLENVSLDVEKRTILGKVRDNKPILRPLDVDFSPGILNVIMGVSGGGKSSLLNLMGRRLSNTPLTSYRSSGSICIGGVELPYDAVRSLTSYVSQSDDSLISTLTVREMIDFAAQLRLPAGMSAHEKQRRAEQVLQRLGLRDCADNLIGDHLVKGISGGEKRRVSIAIQILAGPRILLLDEPTSGLDAFTASSILDTLRGLAAEGTTVIVTVHQARSDHFRHFGSVLLLARGGYPIYAGTGEGMLVHFSSLGYTCPENMNPADFALDLISTEVQSYRKTHMPGSPVRYLISAWEWGGLRTRVVRRISQQLPAQPRPQAPVASHRQQVSVYFATRLLLRRSALSFVRSRPAIMARTTQIFGFTILLTLFYAPLQYNYPGVQSHVGLLQEILAVYFIGMLQNVAIYPQEQAVFRNEHRDQLYGVEPFFISYTLLGMPFDIANSVLVGVMATFAVGLPRTGTVFGVVAFVSFGLVSCGESIGMIFNAFFSSTGFAVSVISVLLSLGVVMSGVLSTGLSGFLGAINHVSPAKWAVAAMAPYTLSGRRFTCTAAEIVDGRCPIQTGDDILQLYHLNESGGMALVWLLVLTISYRLFAYLVLKVVHRDLNVCKLWRWRGTTESSVC